MIRYRGFECDTAEEAVALMRAMDRIVMRADQFVIDTSDNWIPWNGGNCSPLEDDTRVEVKFQNGECDSGIGRYFRWSHIASDFDIVAYRVVS